MIEKPRVCRQSRWKLRRPPAKVGAYIPYEPLNTLKPFAEEVWTVDGPDISMNVLGAALPFPTRMTVVRLPGGGIWIHSPIAWNDDLACSITQLGQVRHLVAPNTLHYWYLKDWRKRFPQARVYGAPGLLRRAKHPLLLDETLDDDAPASWEDAFYLCVVSGTLFTEVDFLHRPTKTLILTDLIENFEPSRVRNSIFRWLIRLLGVADPDGKSPIDMQLNFLSNRPAVRDAVEKMLSWEPERVVLSHGRLYKEKAIVELRRAFRWALRA